MSTVFQSEGPIILTQAKDTSTWEMVLMKTENVLSAHRRTQYYMGFSGSEARLFGFRFLLCHFLAVGLGESHRLSLVYKTGMMPVIIS